MLRTVLQARSIVGGPPRSARRPDLFLPQERQSSVSSRPSPSPLDDPIAAKQRRSDRDRIFQRSPEHAAPKQTLENCRCRRLNHEWCICMKWTKAGGRMCLCLLALNQTRFQSDALAFPNRNECGPLWNSLRGCSRHSCLSWLRIKANGVNRPEGARSTAGQLASWMKPVWEGTVRMIQTGAGIRKTDLSWRQLAEVCSGELSRRVSFGDLATERPSRGVCDNSCSRVRP